MLPEKALTVAHFSSETIPQLLTINKVAPLILCSVGGKFRRSSVGFVVDIVCFFPYPLLI
jgi:hypothetical protein